MSTAPTIPPIGAPLTPTTPPDQKPQERHPGVSKLMGSLFNQVPNTSEKKEEQPPEKKLEKVEKKETPEAPTEDHKPIKVKKLKRPDIPVAAPPAAPAPKEKPAPEPVVDDDLADHEKQALEDARELEKLYPAKYKGHAAKTEKFIRAHIAKLKEYGEDFDGEDEEYKTWLKVNRVAQPNPRDIEGIRTSRIKAELSTENEKKLNEIKHEIFIRDEQPKIKEEGKRIWSELINTSLPDEIANEIKNNGLPEAQKYFKMELGVAQNVIAAAQDDAEEFLRLTTINPATGKSIVPYDQNNPQHARLGEMIHEVCTQFKNSGSAELRKDGKWFATHSEWNSMPAEQRPNYWTFTHREILKRAQAGVKYAVTNAIEQRRRELEEWGWGRPARQTPPIKETPPVPKDPALTTPPAPRPSPLPPGGGTPPTPFSPQARTLASNLGFANKG